jgi:chaperonin GroES
MAKTATSKTTSPTLRPLAGYVLVRPSEGESTTTSGIILPESAQEKPALGEVISIGDGLTLGNGQYLSCPVKVGDKVFYKKWGGDEVKFGGEELKLVKFEDLIAILGD